MHIIQIVNKQNKSILKIRQMKAYAIIRKQPEWVDVIRVKVAQQLNPQVSVGYIKHPKLVQEFHVVPKRYSSVDRSVHIIPKNYNMRETGYKRKSIFGIEEFEGNKQVQKLIKSDVVAHQFQKQPVPMNQSNKKLQDSSRNSESLQKANKQKQSHVQRSIIDSKDSRKKPEMRQQIPIQQILRTTIRNSPNDIAESKLIIQGQPQSNHKQISNGNVNNNHQMIQHLNPMYIKRPIFSKQNKLHYASINNQRQQEQLKIIQKQHQQGQKKSSRLTLTSHLAQWKIEAFQQPNQSRITNGSNSKQIIKQSQNQILQKSKTQKTVQKVPNYIQNGKLHERIRDEQMRQPTISNIQRKVEIDKSMIESQQRNKTQQSIVQRFDVSSKKYSQSSQRQIAKKNNQNNLQNDGGMQKSIWTSKLSNSKQQMPFKKVIGLKKRKKPNENRDIPKLMNRKDDFQPSDSQKKKEAALPIHKLKGKSKSINGMSSSSLNQSRKSQASSTISIKIYKILQMSAIKI